MSLIRPIRMVLHWSLFLLLASVCAFAQTASIFGTVTDATGAAVPGAKVTATQVATRTAEQATSNADGNYVFGSLRPASYDITVEAAGFKTAARTGLLLQVDQRARVDLALQIGEVRETVSVSAEANTVDTFTSTVKEVVDANRMVDLPLNGRNALQLQALLPGSVQMPSGSAATTIAINTASVFAINGARANQSSYTLDGGLNMDMYNNLPAAYPNPDALQEFSILQNAYSAVSGRNAGAVVNMVTRSGTNQLHGALYEFLRNEKLNTRNFFAVGVDPLKRNQFGGTVGGPVLVPKLYNGRDKTFFFFAFEGTRQRLGATSSSSVVPSALERTGDFSQSTIRGVPITVAPPETVTAQNPKGTPFPGNKIPTSRLDPVAQKFTQTFVPLSNLPGGLYTYNLSVPTTDNQTTLKIDHNLGNSNKFAVRYFWDDYFRVQNEGNLPAFNTTYDWITHNVTVNDTHIFSPTVVNTATFTYAKNDFIRSPLATDGAADWKALGCVSCVSLATKPVPTDWNVAVTGGFTARTNTGYDSRMQNFQFIDTLQMTRGNHLFSVGGDLAYVERIGNEAFNVSPNFSFNGQLTGNQGYGVADFYIGAPSSVLQNSVLRSHQYKWTPFVYAQDDWRVSRRLTVNLGARWEPFITAKDARAELGAFRPGQQSQMYPLAPVGNLFAGDPGVPNGLVANKLGKFAPRIGFAWDPKGNGKMSIRAGYGIFGDTVRLVNLNGWPTNQPFSYQVTTLNPYSLTDPYHNVPQTLVLLQSYGPTDASGRATRAFFKPLKINTMSANFTTGYMQQWNFSVQREMPGKFVVSVSYVGSKGTRLMVNEELNPGVYVAGNSTTGNVNSRRVYKDFTNMTSMESVANSTYHSLQTSWNRRFAGGLSILGSFVWSKALDIASSDGNSGTGNMASNPYNWGGEKGLSDYDIRKRFVSSFLWELPFFNQQKGVMRALVGGWQLNGILTLQDGRPFTVTSGVDRSLTGIGKDRADVLQNVAVYGDASRGAMVAKYFDTSSATWQQPALGTFGTVGRNTLISPGLANFDTAMFKQFRVSEGKRFELRWEVFNTLNRPNFAAPTSALSNANFGRITATAGDPRIMQVALKFRY